MKTHLQTRQRSQIDLSMTIYGHFILILMTLVLVTAVPLFKQPTSLHHLAMLKTHNNVIAPVIITIQQNGEYRLNTAVEPEQSLSLEVMKARLKKQFDIIDPKQTSICIKSDPSIAYKQVMEVIEHLHSLGAQHIGLLFN